MSRLAIPATIDAAPVASRVLLEAVEQNLGAAPNVYRLVAASPAALEGLMRLSSALEKGALAASTREGIALAVAEINGSPYCVAAHTYLGKKFAKLDDAEIAANRVARSSTPSSDVAIGFAAKITRERGRVEDADLRALRSAGYDDADIVEIVELVALNIFTNYLNLIAATDVDFPLVKQRRAA